MSIPSFTTASFLVDTTTTCDNCSTDGGPFIDQIILERVTYLTNLALTITLVCYVPILIFGLIGNTISFILLIKSAKTSSTYTYLCSLAVFDNIFLISTIGNWILFSATDGTFDFRQILDCNFVYILILISKTVSAWLVVAVSLERVLVIYLPTKAKSITSVTRARLLVGLIILMSAMVNWQVFGAYVTNRGDAVSGTGVCRGRTPWIEYYISFIRGWIDATVYVYIPIVCLVVLNGAIIAKFTAAARNNKINPNVGQAMAKKSRKMTVMAITLSGTFIVLLLPHTIHKLSYRPAFTAAVTEPLQFYTQFFISQMLSILYRTNHSINLVLYCMTNTGFRKELWRLLTCRKCSRAEEPTHASSGGTRTTKVGPTQATSFNQK